MNDLTDALLEFKKTRILQIYIYNAMKLRRQSCIESLKIFYIVSLSVNIK